MKIDVKTQKDGSVSINATTTPEEGLEAKKQALTRFAPHIKLTGFREGKAPLGMVESQLKQDKLAEETISILSGMVYEKALTDNKLEPITKPHLNLPDLKDIKESEDPTPRLWPKAVEQGLEMELLVYQKPEIDLGDWKKSMAGFKVKDTEDKKVERKQESKPNKQEKNKTSKKSAKNASDKPVTPPKSVEEQVVDLLIQKVEFELAPQLVNGEAQHMLSHQIETTQKLGVDFQEYLKSQNKSIEDLEKELREEAERTLRMRFVLAEIAKAEDLGEEVTFNDVIKHVVSLTPAGKKIEKDIEKEANKKQKPSDKKEEGKKKEKKKS